MNAGFIYGIHPIVEFIKLFPKDIDKLYFSGTDRLELLQEKLKETSLGNENIKNIFPIERLESFDMRRKFGLKEFESPQGLVLQLKTSINKLLELSVEELLLKASEERKIVILLPNVKDQHNLGAVARSCCALGNVAGIILQGRDSAGLSPTTIKISSGGALHLKFAKYNSLNKLAQTLSNSGFKIISFQNKTNSKSLRGFDFERHKSSVLIFGSEDEGIPEKLSSLSHESLFIPQTQKIDSLNLSVAVSIALYEFAMLSE